MILEKQLADLEIWFKETYPYGKIYLFGGKKKDGIEEYKIEFMVNGKYFNAEVDVHPEIYEQDFVFIFDYQRTFLNMQKMKIAQTVAKVLREQFKPTAAPLTNDEFKLTNLSNE